jgi:hypothetical protein
MVSGRQSSNTLSGRCLAVVEHNISRKVHWTLRADCIASSVTRCNSDGFFPVWTPEGAVYAVPPRLQKISWQDLAAVTKDDANMLRHV